MQNMEFERAVEISMELRLSSTRYLQEETMDSQ